MLFALAMFGCQEVSILDASLPPEITFLQPVDGGRFDPDAPVQVCAGIDWEGDVTFLDLALVSDLDGTLATEGFEPCEGGELGIAVPLSNAAHVLSITVTDPQGRTDTATAGISPIDNGAPSCSIVSPLAGSDFDTGELVDVTVQVDDPDGGQLTASLSSGVDGPLGTVTGAAGSALLFENIALSDGPHGLAVNVEDSQGLAGVCVVDVEVFACVDVDLDGFDTCSGDCDDAAQHTNPLAPELPDGRDNDCDGDIDEGTALADDDGDGFSELQGDCDDNDADRYPGATDVPDDGIDQDCSGSDSVTCYTDDDDDDFGVGSGFTAVDGDCFDPGEAPIDGDCDDTNAQRFPGAAEIPADGIDQDCDGTDPAGCFEDLDGDGFGTPTVLPPGDGDCDDLGESAFSTDCDDTDGDAFPGATETLGDGIDQDCNGADSVACFEDADFDTYGSVNEVVATDGSCDTGDNESTNEDDCDDTNNTVFPGAPEVPGDGIDQDCSGGDASTCFEDHDGDGFGGQVTISSSDGDCDDPGESADNDDCDDSDPFRNPDANDVPNDGLDQDCSGADAAVCFEDFDMDGFGSDVEIIAPDGSCTTGQQEATNDLDCDDSRAEVRPNGTEIPDDGLDQDCSGADQVTCYVDDDEDGFGTSVVVLADDGVCDTATNEADNSADCNDGDAAINPAAGNCSGTDADGDGYDEVLDCDDTDPDVNPGETEVRDTIDNNCDGLCDEGFIGVGDLIVTEIQSDPEEGTTATRGEWFEIHNPTTNDIRMCGGWVFADSGQDAYTMTGGLLVPAGGYVVAGANGDLANNGGVEVDYVYVRNEFPLGNNSNGDSIILRFDGVDIDFVSYGTEPRPGISRQLSHSRLDAVSNDDVDNWCDSTSAWTGSAGDYGSPGAANATCP